MKNRIKDYWDNRYKKGCLSGQGSYGRLAEFKVNIINNFIKTNSLKSIIDIGCGDGNIGSQIIIENYLGCDISDYIIDKNKETYHKLNFKYLRDLKESDSADITLSADVLFHLVLDEDFKNHMQQLFLYSLKYIIIYSSCEDKSYNSETGLVRHRNFIKWMDENDYKYNNITKINNKFPVTDRKLPESFADFYIITK